MEQTRALNALEPFIALSKSANSPRAAADLITQATSAPNTYVFAELLQTPNIQNLRNAESENQRAYYTLLEIFAWGTYADYKAKQQSLPSLTENQHQKLLLLSLLPLAHSHTTLSYTALLSALDLPTTHALEQLITTAIYAGLLTGTLDPAHSHVNVTSVAPLRDLAPGSLPTLQSALANWEARCDDAVRDLEKKAQAVRQGAVEREKEKRKRERALEVMLGKDGATGSGATGSSKKAPGQTEEEDTLMDLDDAGPPGGGSTWGGQTRSSRKMGGFQGLGRKLG